MHPEGSRLRRDASRPLSAVAVIPARFHSTRFPGKPLADLDGRPLIEHVYRRAAEAPGINRVLVATDDERIRAAVAAFGGAAVMTRVDHPSGTDRVAEVAAGLACDLVVNVQGDEPLVEPGMIAEALAPFAGDADLPMATLCRRLEDPAEFLDPDVVKVVVDGSGDALYFSRAPVPYPRSPAGSGVPGPARKHVGLYVYRREFLLTLASLAPTPLECAESLEQLRPLEHGFRIRTIETAYDSIGVDTPRDLERVRRRLAAQSQVTR